MDYEQALKMQYLQFIIIRPGHDPIAADVYANGQGAAVDFLNEVYKDIVACICLNPVRPESIDITL